MSRYIHLDLFSGMGGFALGLKQAGHEFTDHFYSEVDPHAIANYKYNFKNAKYVGSVTDVSGIIDTINKQPDDRLIITFGSPCQDFSLAGRRAGVEGSKSSLIKFALILIERLRPDIYIWENVKGAYSTNNGADFWGIIQAFANIDGYRFEQQLLNTSWVLPQNRERIYLIGHLGDRSKPRVFPFTENDFRVNERAIDSPNIRTLSAGGHSGGLHSQMTLVRHRSTSPFKQEDIAQTLRNGDKGEVRIVTNTSKGFEIAKPGDSINFSNPNSKTRRGRVGKDVAQTLDTHCNQGVILGNLYPSKHEAGNIYGTNGISPTIKCNGPRPNMKNISPKVLINGVIQINPSIESGGKQPYQQNRIYDENGLVPALNAGKSDLLIADQRGRGKQGELKQEIEIREDGLTNSLTSVQRDNLVITDINFKNRVREYNDNSPTITQNVVKGLSVSNIRRLTETEVETLQGFPKQWTQFGIYETKKGEEIKPIPKTQRYKLCGNAVTATIVKIIGERLK